MSTRRIPSNLELMLSHLNIVRELNRYLHEKGIEKDVSHYVKEVVGPEISLRVPALKGCRFDADEWGAYWYPESWTVRPDSYDVAVCVLIPSPVDPKDPDPSVNIWVAQDWSGHRAFSERSASYVEALLKKGFGHFSEHPDWLEEFPVVKYVSWLETDGTFNDASLLDRISAEVKKIVVLEQQVSAAVSKARSTPVRKKKKRQSSPQR